MPFNKISGRGVVPAISTKQGEIDYKNKTGQRTGRLGVSPIGAFLDFSGFKRCFEN